MKKIVKKITIAQLVEANNDLVERINHQDTKLAQLDIKLNSLDSKIKFNPLLPENIQASSHPPAFFATWPGGVALLKYLNVADRLVVIQDVFKSFTPQEKANLLTNLLKGMV